MRINTSHYYYRSMIIDKSISHFAIQSFSFSLRRKVDSKAWYTLPTYLFYFMLPGNMGVVKNVIYFWLVKELIKCIKQISIQFYLTLTDRTIYTLGNEIDHLHIKELNRSSNNQDIFLAPKFTKFFLLNTDFATFSLFEFESMLNFY